MGIWRRQQGLSSVLAAVGRVVDEIEIGVEEEDDDDDMPPMADEGEVEDEEKKEQQKQAEEKEKKKNADIVAEDPGMIVSELIDLKMSQNEAAGCQDDITADADEDKSEEELVKKIKALRNALKDRKGSKSQKWSWKKKLGKQGKIKGKKGKGNGGSNKK